MNTASRFTLRAAATLATGAAILVCGLLIWASPSPAAGLPGRTADATPAEGAELATAAQPLARREVEAQPGFYAARTGTELTYGVRGHFEYALTHAESGRHPAGFQVGGKLQVLVADRRADTILLRVELLAFGLAALAGGTGSDAAGLGEAARQPFWVKLGTDGAVRGYRFAEGLIGEHRNFLRGVFSAYAHKVPHDAQGSWEADDADAAGPLVARFELRDGGDADSVQVERRKLRYSAMAGGELHPHTFVGGSRATFSRALGWLRAVAVDERTTIDMGDLGVEVDVRTVLGFDLVANGTGSVDPAASTLWEATWLTAAGHTEELGAHTEAEERARWSKTLANASLQSLMDALGALLLAQPQDPEAIDHAWLAIQWLVRLRPETAGEIQQRVASGLEPRLAGMLVTALGAAGIDEAQHVLAAMRRDGGLSPELRTSAGMSMFQLARPNERVLGELATDLDAAADFAGDDALGMLLLGALAPRAGDVCAGGRTPLDTLLALEGKAAQQGRLDLWLNALGNAGTDDVVPHAQRLTAHDDEQVRAAAYHALRKVENRAALVLLERGLSDPSPRVRADVVAALGQHHSEAASATLIRAARDDSDAEVRRASMSELVRFAKPGSAARQTLEHLAQSDPDLANRQAARDFLAGLR